MKSDTALTYLIYLPNSPIPVSVKGVYFHEYSREGAIILNDRARDAIARFRNYDGFTRHEEK